MSRKEDIKKMMDDDVCRQQLKQLRQDILSGKMCEDCLNYENRKVK